MLYIQRKKLYKTIVSLEIRNVGMLTNIDEGWYKNMCGQFENVCRPVNYGSNLPWGKFNFRNSYIPDIFHI